MTSGGESVIGGEKHVLFIENDFVEFRVIKGPDFLFALGILLVEKA